MFIVSLSYTAALEEIDVRLAEHVEWLEAGYAAGVFLASGRKVPRDGGVILARGERAALEARLADDPFARAGLARYEITEFIPTMTVDELTAVRERLPA
ncbi:YciI family protein [Crenobacter sp. SG2305]|uniref:YciI family protein n=1 Tax=Crenobacter oryzisoli TaxID=3056844 RepID=UPI0025AA8032|nr:YciI family protein [Crenobacter sp. SG2305]MDN0085350.1 YciI family protein [Crenobacter sp. SG2305]